MVAHYALPSPRETFEALPDLWFNEDHPLTRAYHRLLVWDLGEAGNQLAGQYYVEVDGKFFMDDMPNAERSKLQQVLESFRKQTTK